MKHLLPSLWFQQAFQIRHKLFILFLGSVEGIASKQSVAGSNSFHGLQAFSWVARAVS